MPTQPRSNHLVGDAPLSDDPVRPQTPAGPGVSTARGAKPLRTRTGAVWFGICVGALVLVALVVFMLQNTAPVEVAFLGMTGTAPLAMVLLIAGLGVGIVALVVGALRIGQLRRRIRADRQAATARPAP